MLKQVSDFINITLNGEPQSTNNIYRSHCRFGFPSVYMSANGKTLKTDYQWQIKSQYHGKPIKGDIKMKVDLYLGTKRKQDIDNFNKILYDSLTGILYIDDSQIIEVLTRKLYDPKSPRIELFII